MKRVEKKKRAYACVVCGHFHEIDESHVFNYVDELSPDSDVMDPVMLEPLFDPVQLPCGHGK